MIDKTALLCMALLALVAVNVNAETWPLTERLEFRFETHSNVTPQQAAQGQAPLWKVEEIEEDGQPVLHIGGDEVRKCTGYIYVGRRIRLPEKVPSTAVVRLAYQRECTAANRAPSLILCVVTPEGWDGLDRTAVEAKARRRHGRGVLLGSATVVAGQEDTLNWTDWESPNLVSSLRRRRGQDVVVALRMAGMHTGATEWAKIKSPELIMERAKPKQVSRTRKYPPKEHRTLRTDEEVALARARCEQDKRARSIREGGAKRCRFWMEKSDDEIRAIIPPADVPRAFNVSVRGCPVHGKKIYRHGTYPWRLSIDKPLTITCPVGGEQYPSNDYWAYYRSSFADAASLKGKYVDDGWGWKSPSGEIYWLVGYGCHWYWNRYTLPGVLNLSRAYLVTGDAGYAHKAAVMLDRIADVYPSMEYEHQSRYGFETGGRYRGKILNHIWETGTVRKLAEAYDNIFDALRDGSPLEGKLAKSCRETRANIEANILEEAIERIQDGAISGNFGMHQCALAMAAVVRETGPTQETLDWMLRQSGKSRSSHEGVEYAFYNFIYRDGMPFETSPSYCFGWVANFASLARVLEKGGYDFYGQPKFKAMLDAFLDLVCIGKFTPAIGDAGSIKSGWIGGSTPVYAAGLAHYGDVRYAHALRRLGVSERTFFRGYDSLFESAGIQEALAAIEKTLPPVLKSRVLDGYGLGVLNNADDSVAVSIYYGTKGGHGHFDRLNFSLFAHGQKMTPDLGYPDFMNALVPTIVSWSKNTVSHNCVVVDRHRQLINVSGKVRAFVDTPGVRLIDVSADETYDEASVYRRALLLVDLGPDSAYLVDMFTVSGGEQHDYSLHGPLGEFEVVGGELSKPQKKGTLAGEDVAYGQFYDDAVLGDPKYRGSYGGYKGSGFQYLENVQRLAAGKWWAQWRLEDTKDIGLRLRILDQPEQELFVADGRVSPTGKNPWVLKYLIARRRGKDLQSRYVSLLEPFQGEPAVADVSRLEVDGADAESCYAIEVRHRNGVDVIVYQTQPQPVTVPSAELQTDASLCVARLKPDRQFASLYVLNGTYARVAGREVNAEEPYVGTIADVNYAERSVRLTLEGERSLPANDTLGGRPIIFSSAQHSCLYTIRGIQREGREFVVALNEPEIMTGRAQIAEVREGDKEIRTGSHFGFPMIYPGMRAVNEAKTVSIPVESVGRGAIRLAGPCRAADFTDDNNDGVTDAWLCDFGPGDGFRVDSVTVISSKVQ